MTLPDLGSVSYDPELRIMNFDKKILLCGDHTVNGSLNAAQAFRNSLKKAISYLRNKVIT